MMLFLAVFFFLQIADPFGLRKPKPDANLEQGLDVAEDAPRRHPTNNPRQFFTLGSLDTAGSDCLLVTLDSRGAGVRRIELVQRDAKGRFLTREVENKSGYLGYLELQADATGCLIGALPSGSPLTTAVAQGDAPLPVRVGDRLLSIDQQPIRSDFDLQNFLGQTLPGQAVTVQLARRSGAAAPIPATTAADAALSENSQAGDAATNGDAAEAAAETPAETTAETPAMAAGWSEYTVQATLMDRPKQMLGPEYRNLSEKVSDQEYPGTLDFSLQDARLAGWQELDLAMQQDNWEGRQYVDADGRDCVEFTYRLPRAVYRRLLKTSEALTAVLAPEADVPGAAEPAGARDGAVVVVKRFRLPRVAAEQRHDPAVAGYHVEMEVDLYNQTDEALDVAYRLGGPVATSIEGWWYQIKLHGGFWKIGYSAGARDVVTSTAARPYQFYGRAEIDTEVDKNGVFTVFPRDSSAEERTVRYAAVDTLYFASALLPQATTPTGLKPASTPAASDSTTAQSNTAQSDTAQPDTAQPDAVVPDALAAGAATPDEAAPQAAAGPAPYVCYSGFAGPVGAKLEGRDTMKHDLSFRLYNTVSLPPSPAAGEPDAAEAEDAAPSVSATPGYRQTFHLFAGPKRPELLSTYALDDTVSFGWFGMFSLPLLWLLHALYYLIGNYALAIILLTVVVRLLMMPISRKAVINAQMMQALAPEMKKIKEKYPENLEKQGLAQRELFRRFKYNPFSGCLIVFLQLPIFVGLYRGLSVDFELRDQPLLPGMSWCSNMAGPDQLWNWSSYLPTFIAGETGWLGPYFNLLPILTIVLFIAQQKIFMPPPTDEQQALMQKMMSYMMIFMGFLFFKVPAGLCIYFITSSIWGLIERAVIPKPQLSQDILDSIARDGDLATSNAVVAKPLPSAGKTQLDDKSRQELRERERQRQRRLKDKQKE